ncbi:MAG: hypothetical protein ACE5FT_05760 [Candidatus Nanoarchaeia archaeon]
MKAIVVALKELKSSLVQIRLAESIIDSLLVFSIFYVVCLLILLPPVLAGIPFALFFVYTMSHRVGNVHSRDVETKVPVLTDQLSTAADNLYRDNEIVNGLHRDVLNLMKHVRLSYFINFKKIWRRIMILAVLCFTIILLSAWNVHFVDYKVVAKELGSLVNDQDFTGLGGGEGGGLGGDDNFTEIFGNETLAELGANQLDLQINPIMSEINIEDIKEAQEREFEESVFPEDITATTDASFDEKIPKEHRDIVKRYFEKISSVR